MRVGIRTSTPRRRSWIPGRSIYGLGPWVLVGLSLLVVPPPAGAAGPVDTIVTTVSSHSAAPGGSVDVQITVHDGSGAPVDVDAPADLVEVRDDAGSSLPFRPLVERSGVGVYHAHASLSHSGTWTIVIAPDLTDVVKVPSLIHIAVAPPVSPAWPDYPTTIASISLVLVIVLAVALFQKRLRRSRRASKAPPEPEAHDTWWW